MPLKKTISDYSGRMDKAVEHYYEELRGVRTGQASTGLVDNLRVECYGSVTPLKQLATIATPQPDTIIIKPFDPNIAKDIERAIKNSDLSIAPILEGKLIRLSVPSLSQERRTQLVNQVKNAGEQAKVSIRNIRRDANKELEQEEKDSAITEDDFNRGKKEIDDITRKHTDKIDEMIKQKSEEILSG